MCVVVRYFDKSLQRINDSLWDVLENYEDQNDVGNAETLLIN